MDDDTLTFELWGGNLLEPRFRITLPNNILNEWAKENIREAIPKIRFEDRSNELVQDYDYQEAKTTSSLIAVFSAPMPTRTID